MSNMIFSIALKQKKFIQSNSEPYQQQQPFLDLLIWNAKNVKLVLDAKR